jgi:hypothetical protein
MHCLCLPADDYTYALERDRKPAKSGRSRGSKGTSLREGLLSRSTLHTGNSDAASGGYSGLNSINLSNCTSLTSSEMASLHLHSGDDGEQPAGSVPASSDTGS